MGVATIEKIIEESQEFLIKDLNELKRSSSVLLCGAYLRKVRIHAQSLDNGGFGAGVIYHIEGNCEYGRRKIRLEFPPIGFLFGGVCTTENEVDYRHQVVEDTMKRLRAQEKFYETLVGKPIYVCGKTNFWKTKINVTEIGMLKEDSV